MEKNNSKTQIQSTFDDNFLEFFANFWKDFDSYWKVHPPNKEKQAELQKIGANLMIGVADSLDMLVKKLPSRSIE